MKKEVFIRVYRDTNEMVDWLGTSQIYISREIAESHMQKDEKVKEATINFN